MTNIWTSISSLEPGSYEIVAFGLTIFLVAKFVTSFIPRSIRQEDKNATCNKRWQINQNRKITKNSPSRHDYPNGWFGLMESNQLNKNEAKEAIIYGKEVVAWRGENGVAYVADAYCPHLGAHLGVEGEVKGNCIQCPFHNWQFDGSQAGKLTSIPYSNKLIENIHLKMWRTIEQNGFIWLWHHAEDKEPSWEPPIVPDTTSYYAINVLDSVSDAHPQDISENGADYSHLNVVHGTVVPRSLTFLYSLLPVTILWRADWKPETENQKLAHVSSSSVHLRFTLFGKWTLGESEFSLTQYGPGMVFSETSSLLGRTRVVLATIPINKRKTRSIQKAYCSNRAVQIFQWFFSFSVKDQVYRDTKIWNRQRSMTTPTLVKEDAAIKTFRKWYSQFYSNSKQSQ